VARSRKRCVLLAKDGRGIDAREGIGMDCRRQTRCTVVLYSIPFPSLGPFALEMVWKTAFLAHGWYGSLNRIQKWAGGFC
jgi:hypothetical protein